MIKVLYNNKEYDVPENEVDKFVSISPGAQIMKNGDPGKQTPAVQGATVEETAAPDTELISEDTSLDLPKDPNKTIKEKSKKTPPGFWESAGNLFKYTFGIGQEDKGLAGEMGDIRTNYRKLEKLEKGYKIVEDDKEFEKSKQFKFLQIEASRKNFEIKDKEQALDYLNNKRKEYSDEIFNSLISTQKYQNILSRIPNPEVFDEDGLTRADFASIAGTQAAQMATAIVSFGGSTFAQESTNVAMDLLTKAAIEKNSLSESEWSSYADNIKADLMLNIIESGEAGDIFRKAETTGAINAGLDLVGNFFIGVKALKVAPKGAFRNVIQGKVTKDLKKYGTEQLKGLGVELVTESAQETISNVAKGEGLPTPKEYAEILAQTAIGAGSIQTTVAGTKNITSELIKEGVATYNPESLRAVANETRTQIKAQVLDKKVQNEVLNLIDKAEIIASDEFSNLNSNSKKQVFDLLVENQIDQNNLNNLQSQLNNIKNNNNESISLENDINEINLKITENNIKINKEKIFNNQIQNGKDLSFWVNDQKSDKWKDYNVINFKNKEQAKKYFETKNIDLNAKENASLNNMVNEGDVNGAKKGKIAYVIEENILNNVRKGKLTALNTFHHEIMHLIFDGQIKGNPEILNNLRKSIEPNIPTELKDLVKARMLSYKNAKLTDKDQEFFAALSDVFRVVELRSDLAPNFKSIGNEFKKQFAKDLKNIDLSGFNAENTLEFIQKFNDFNGIPNLGTRLKQIVSKADVGKGIETEDEALASIEETASKRVQELYEEKGFDNAFEIIEQFNPIINKLVERRREAPGFNKQELTSAIKYDDRGVLGLIKSYNPESKVPLAAYINKFLPSRMIEASNAVLGQEFTTDITEAKIITAEQDIVVSEEKQLAKIKPSKIYSPEQYNKAKKLVIDESKNISIDRLTFKKLGNITASITEEVVKIPASKFTNPKSNLTKNEVVAARMFINKNLNTLFKTLPEGAVVEGTAASEFLIGTATGVPRGILNSKLYIKQERGKKGAGLFPYVKNPKAKPEDILDLIGKPGDPVSPRSPQAQIAKGFINIFDKNITNEIFRTEVKLNPQQEVDVAAGKAEALASREDLALTERLNEIDENIPLLYDYNTTSGTKKFIKEIKEILPEFPDGFLNKTILVNGKHPKRQIMRNAFDKIAKLKIKDKKYAKTKWDTKLVEKTTIEQKRVINKRNVSNFVEGWNIVNKIINEKPYLVPTLLHMFRVSVNEGTHWHRLGAEYVGVKKIYKGKLYFEHALQNVAAYRLLVEEAVKKDRPFNEVLEALIKNYKLIAITKEDNAQIDAKGLKNDMDFDGTWNIFNNKWWERYINAELNFDNYVTLDNESFTDAFLNDTALASKELNNDFNTILEKKTGIEAFKKFGKVKGKVRGKKVKGIMNFFIPHSAEDFQGLMYALLPKGKEGNIAMEWMKQNLFKPYSQAMENISKERAAIMNDFKALKIKLSNVPKSLKEKINKESDFTNQDAIRVFIWARQGMKIPGLSTKDQKQLINIVKNNKDYTKFASSLININKSEGYIKPDNNWIAGTITTDLLENLNKVKRKKHLEKWKENINAIFTEENKNKLRAAYGDNYINSLENILKRMESGRNRVPSANKQVDNWLDWLNNSVGAIMFLNVRSAVLQTISTVNYMNWSDNNPLMAAKAFANPKQYWKDFAMIFNSDYLKERRGELQLNIAENEIADAAQKGGVKGAISYLLNKGFILTRSADSFAIANGGAAFYRNRINSYKKQGLSEKEAENKAFIDFKELTEEAQQSSRPDRISMEQASGFGRVILAFANTPMQYTRLMKRASQDLINKRGDWKTNMSKLIYYGAVQNFIFNALQQALFVLGFDSEEEKEKQKEKYQNILMSMLDSILRGTGVAGNAVMVGKNFAIDIAKRAEKPRPNFQDAAWRLLDISPPLDSKITKMRSALYTLEYEGDKMIEDGISLDNPAAMATAQVVSATTNIPLDRVMRLYDNAKAAVASDTEAWQRVALILGWSTWELGIQDEKTEKVQRRKGRTIVKRKIK